MPLSSAAKVSVSRTLKRLMMLLIVTITPFAAVSLIRYLQTRRR